MMAAPSPGPSWLPGCRVLVIKSDSRRSGMIGRVLEQLDDGYLLLRLSASTYQLTSRPFQVQLLMILSLRPHRSVLAKNLILKMRRWRPL